MTRDEFLSKKQPIWTELEEALKRTRRYRTNKLSPSQLDRLGYLYRRVTSDLAVARRDFPDDRCVPYLNALASRAHAGIYQSSPLKRNTIRHFFLAGFPTLFRSNISFITAAFFMFVIGFIAAYWIAFENQGLAEKLAPKPLVEKIHDQEMWTDTPAHARNLFASDVMTNNVGVAFAAFALGITFMVGTTYILALNGVFIGAVAGLCHVHGLALPLWAFVSPHGYVELTTIFIAGGAGLKIGYALITPGLLTRKHALIDAAKVAVQLIGGCVVLLVIAGVIEGFVSPSSLPPIVKIGFGFTTGVLLFCYLFLLGRPKGKPVPTGKTD
ncbi:MAG: stage II sporulation protein M [Candidatus Poribacteria bacterium]|nr:stage II sporulation protein M [Candidatus Poribacteria bacterium]MDE0505095.1 stage II sporulation protein M [Candidatus Poribacteria bacterium]